MADIQAAREIFAKGYMERSELLPFTMDGEVVTYITDTGEPWLLHALECHCDEDGCEGWAMIPDGSQNWHKFQNDLTDMTFAEACAADHAVREAKEAAP